MTDVRFFFDPACPWTWITARWLVEVANERSFGITWETFSLRYRNRDNPGYDWIRDELDAQYPALRIVEAVRARNGNAAVGAEALSARISRMSVRDVGAFGGLFL